MIRADNTATFYVGKTDLGQGTGTAFRQIMSDELDIAYDQHQLRDGQHRRHRRSGRLRRLGRACRPTAGRCAASRRRRAACCSRWRRRDFGVPVDRARRERRRDHASTADPSKRVTYGELIGGKRFNVTLTGKNIDSTTGVAPLKTVQELKIVGQVAAALRHPAQGGRLA